MKNSVIALLLIMTTISCTNAQKQFSSKSKKQKLTTLEGKEVSFEIKSVSYTEVEGLGESLIRWAIVK